MAITRNLSRSGQAAIGSSMIEPLLPKSTVTLGPGDFLLNTPSVQEINTILGSCVCVLIIHASSNFYCISHYVNIHPELSWSRKQPPNGRYGNLILPYFLDEARKRGIERKELDVFLFGGAGSPNSENLPDHFQVGVRNKRFALDFVARNGMTLAAQDLGGQIGRRLAFFPETSLFELMYLENT